MKRINFCLSLVVLFLVFSCNNSKKTEIVQTTIGEAKKLALTSISFDSEKFEFGKITQGETVEHTYTFTNTGKSDLVIEEVQASCGCTTPDYTKEYVKPGGKGKIVVKFNSAGREGHQSKSVNVYANTSPDMTRLHFTAEVELPKK